MAYRIRALGAAPGLALLAGATGALAEEWPDLPVGVKNGIAARAGDKLIVGLGSAGSEVYALDLNDKASGWQALARFEGPPPSQPAAAVSDGKLYIFSGSGKESPEAASPIIFDTVSVYDPEADVWETVDTTTPAGLLGASAVSLEDGRIAILGGYDKELFDKYLADVTAIDKEAEPEKWDEVVDSYMGMEPAEYRWNDLVLVYDTESNVWSDLGKTPSLPNTGSAVVETGPGSFLVINGEIKPGLRTDEVKSVNLGSDDAEWDTVASLPAPEGSRVQEGLAGAYAGLVGGDVLVAGGANFPGARAKADAGEWYAHEGLSKHWASEVFVLHDGEWSQVGTMPEGLAYGAAFTVDGGVLVVGGEDGSGTARADVFLLGWDGSDLNAVD